MTSGLDHLLRLPGTFASFSSDGIVDRPESLAMGRSGERHEARKNDDNLNQRDGLLRTSGCEHVPRMGIVT